MKTAILKQISYLTSAAMILMTGHSVNAQSVAATLVPLVPGPPILSAGTSDYFTFSVANQPFSLTIPEGSPLEGQIIIPTLNGAPIPGNPAALTTVLYDDAALTQVSDVFGVIPDPLTGLPVFAFISDADTSPLAIPPVFLNPNGAPPTSLLETGVPLPVGADLLLPGVAAVSGEFFSDAERSVPDGGTTSLLLGMGGIGLALIRRKLT